MDVDLWRYGDTFCAGGHYTAVIAIQPALHMPAHTPVPHKLSHFHRQCQYTQQKAACTAHRTTASRRHCLFSPGNAVAVQQLVHQRPASAGHRQWWSQITQRRAATLPTLHCEPPPLAPSVGLVEHACRPQTLLCLELWESLCVPHLAPSISLHKWVGAPITGLTTTPRGMPATFALRAAAARPSQKLARLRTPDMD